MGKYIGSTRLTYLWGKLKTYFASKTDLAAHPTARIYYGTCSTAAKTYAKSATVETFPLDANNLPLAGTIIAVKYANSNSYKTAGQTHTLNVNNTGDFPLYYNNAELVSTTSANTLVAGYANRYVFYMFNGTQWVFISASYDTNSTYSAMTQAEITAGTGTTGRTLTPKLLRDNFYTEGEVDTLVGAKYTLPDTGMPATDLASAVQTSLGLADTAYQKPSGGIPSTDMTSDVQTSLGLADTALQSYTESDPVFTASAAHGISSSDITNWNAKLADVDGSYFAS